MHNVSVALTNKLKQSIDVNSSLRLIAEWNLNRYAQITSVTNGTVPIADEYDNDIFPITSIVEPERPTRGILKGWSTATVGVQGADAFTTDNYTDRVNGARFTTASKDNKYKYWTSKNQSGASSPYPITQVTPTVIYANPTYSNKIYICFENSYASPTTYDVQVTLNGTTWTTVAQNVAIDSKGRVMLYRQANGTWSTTVHREAPQQIRGVRLSVTNMSAPAVRFNLIELGARLESDLTSFVASYNVSNSMSETSFIAPIGKASSNTGSVELDNSTLRFVNDNPASLYYNLLDKNVEFRMDMGINIGTYAAPNFEWVRQFTMRTENWGGQTYEGTNVDLKDASDYLQKIKPPATLLQNVTVGEAIWRLLDSVGFSDWAYNPTTLDNTTLLPQCWFDGERTVWEEIQDLAEATQTAVFFDEYGVLQIKTRSSAYDLAASPVWTLDEHKNGTKQADIVSLQKVNDFEANIVNVSYKPTSLSKENEIGGVPIMESVWEPEGTVTLRSSQLASNFLSNYMQFFISAADAVLWQYSGLMQIQGEIVKYDAKEYGYYNAVGTKVVQWITSDEEKKKLDRLNPTLAYRNAFTGKMRVAPNGRGMWNTVALNHYAVLNGWNINRYRTISGTVRTWNGGLIHNLQRSTLTLRTNATFTPNSWYVCTVGADANPVPMWYGTRFKFDTTGYSYGAAGMAISAGANDQGYFVELVKTASITANDRSKYTHELCFYVRNSSGLITRIGPNGGKGVPMNVAPDVWYDMDVQLTTASGGAVHNISISINGVVMMTVALTTQRLTLTGRHGLFTRGHTSAEFEYLYSSIYTTNSTSEIEEWWNRIRGGFQSGKWDREFVYGYSADPRIVTSPNTALKTKKTGRFFDEFGPIAHEIREFDVKFSKTPVTYSNIYLSNDAQTACIEYNGDAFGAKFILANVSRNNAVVSGEDTLTFGSENAVEQKLMIYGRTFSQEDVKTHTVKDEQGIKRRGEITTDVESPWIQSESAAKGIGDWIVKHWATGADELEVEVFGNPVLQLLDVVAVNMASSSMTAATHEYFIVRIDQNYSEGLDTKLTLRRRKI